MPTLPNARHERFAQEVAKGLPAGRAYEAAGYGVSEASADSAGSRLLKNVKVAERVKELKERAADRAEITQADVIRGLYAEATDPNNNGGVRVTAWTWLGKHVGAFEADNKQKAPETITWAVVHTDRPPDADE